MQDITKHCADHLRFFFKNHDIKLKAGHAHELVAAFFGYQSRAALLADTQCPIQNLIHANVIIEPPMAFSEQRRMNLEDLPPDLPDTNELSVIVYTSLAHLTKNLSKFWSHHDLERQMMILAHDYQRQPHLKEIYPSTLSHKIDIETNADGIRFTFFPFYNLSFQGTKIQYLKTSTTVWLQRIAGHIGYAKPEISCIPTPFSKFDAGSKQ
jgi:hypothetical protein